MSQPLSSPLKKVQTSIRALGIKINEELGYRDQRLQFQNVRLRDGTHRWAINNTFPCSETSYSATSAVLATSKLRDFLLSFGYNEEWKQTKTATTIEFSSSNLRFAVTDSDGMPILAFRLEWAGAQLAGAGIAYPGAGAAHPHWQFDFETDAVSALHEHRTDSDSEEISIDLETDIDEIDLENSTLIDSTGVTKRVNKALSIFHRIHLPARSHWHERVCVMPDDASAQQHTPSSREEVERWVISALRYMKSEFERYY